MFPRYVELHLFEIHFTFEKSVLGYPRKQFLFIHFLFMDHIFGDSHDIAF